MKLHSQVFAIVSRLSLLAVMLLLSSSLMAQNARKLTGTVLDENGEGLFGAAVTEAGTTNGVITDMDGNFAIQVSNAAKTLEITFIGYTTETVQIPSTGSIVVRMEPDRQMLQETVVIGYGVQRKSDLTGSVSNVSSEDFNQGVINSPEQLINGKVSGVQIVNGGGSPSAGST